MKNEKYKTLAPLTHTPMLSTSDFPLKGGESVRGGKSPFKGDLEGLVFFIFHFSFFIFCVLQFFPSPLRLCIEPSLVQYK